MRVGKRVWLPFLRARRYMPSRQSLLTHSLIQYFWDAERPTRGAPATTTTPTTTPG